MLKLAVGHWMEETLRALAALHCNNTCTLMGEPIRGTARGLNPIDPRVYGPACSTRADKCIPRAKPEGYICLPECVDFDNVDLSKAAESRPPYRLSSTNFFYAG